MYYVFWWRQQHTINMNDERLIEQVQKHSFLYAVYEIAYIQEYGQARGCLHRVSRQVAEDPEYGDNEATIWENQRWFLGWWYMQFSETTAAKRPKT